MPEERFFSERRILFFILLCLLPASAWASLETGFWILFVLALLAGMLLAIVLFVLWLANLGGTSKAKPAGHMSNKEWRAHIVQQKNARFQAFNDNQNLVAEPWESLSLEQKNKAWQDWYAKPAQVPAWQTDGLGE